MNIHIYTQECCQYCRIVLRPQSLIHVHVHVHAQPSLLQLLYLLQSVYMSHLVRKDKLVKCFEQLGLFKEDVRLPAEVRVSP